MGRFMEHNTECAIWGVILKFGADQMVFIRGLVFLSTHC